MLKAVSARRGMPFEWSFLLDALQTERDQGITIDTTQIRFRTGARDIVLIDAPGHAEFLRNMITGASQADGAVLIIDALEGVRDQTRRHGYLLHLLGVNQVAVVVNKMDRVDFSAARFERDQRRNLRASQRPRRHADGGDSDLGARRRRRRRAHDADRLVPAARPWSRRSTRSSRRGRWKHLPLRLPVQAIYKFDDRRIVAGRIESGSLASRRRDRHHAGRQDREDPDSVEGWPVTPVTGRQSAGRSVGITLDRELFIERGDVIAHVGKAPARYAPAARPDLLAARPAARQGRADPGPARHARSARHRGRDREGGRSGRACRASETTAIARNHVGEIEIALASRSPPMPTPTIRAPGGW